MPRITLLFTALNGLLLLVLVGRVSRLRHGRRIGFGDGGDPELARAIRVHANFVEHVPFALLLLGLLELNGLAAPWLWTFGSAMLVARLMHAAGLSKTSGASFGRFYGTALTWVAILAMALAGLWRFFA